MKKNVCLLLAGVLLAGVTAGCGSTTTSNEGDGSTGGTVNYIGWSGTDNSVIQKVEEKTGLTINYTPFNSLEEMMTKVMSNGAKYDLVMSGDYMITTLAEQGILQEIDHSKVDAWDDIDESYLNPSWDADNTYSVPMSGGHVGILVNRDKIDATITSYADLWNPELASQIVILDDQRIMLGLAGILLGNDFNGTDEADLVAQEAKLEELIANVKSFQSFSQHVLMGNGEANIAVGWSSEAYRASLELDNWEYIYPSEGMHMYTDCFVIPTSCSNIENAYAVINAWDAVDVLTISGEVSPGGSYANTAYVDTLPDEQKNSVIMYPPAEESAKAHYLINLGDQMAVYDTTWTEFKQKASIE